MLLFIVVAAWLYVTYTKPELAPGHRNPAVERPMIYTAVPGPPPAAATARTRPGPRVASDVYSGCLRG